MDKIIQTYNPIYQTTLIICINIYSRFASRYPVFSANKIHNQLVQLHYRQNEK